VFDLTLSWIVIGALALVWVAVLLSVQTSAYLDRTTLRFGTGIGLPLVNDEVAAAVRRHLRIRTSANGTGALLGLVVAGALLFVAPSLGSRSFTWLVVVPAVLTGMSAAEVLSALRESRFRHRADSTRIARSTATTLKDYVSPWRLRLAPAFQILAGVLCAIGLGLGAAGRIDATTFLRGAAIPFFALSLVVTLASMVAQRRILLRPQPVADTLELAWDDAIRAETLRGLRLAQTLVAWLAAAAAVFGMLQALDALAGTTWSTGIGPQAFVWGWLAITSLFSYGGARTRFRVRLWPDLAAIGAGRTSGRK
jgi:hypothetical protein